MDYFISFLEGIITFISPCLLPMLPIYISYFTGQENDKKPKNAFINAIGFVIGFAIVFVILGAFAGAIGGILRENKLVVNITSGIIVIIFGLSYLDAIRLPLIKTKLNLNMSNIKFFSSVIFGIIFSLSWTPCVGAFLGSALMLAAQTGDSLKGMVMLICYSIGLGIPFIIMTILLDQLKNTFDFIKHHFSVIKVISGMFLIIMGILMATGYMGYFVSLMTF